MNRRVWLVVGAVWFCAAPRAPGDTLKGGQPTHSSAAAARQSFRPLGDKIDPSTVDEILSARLRDVMEQGKLHDVQQLFGDKVLLRKLTRDKLSPDQLKFLDANSDKIGELLKDPRFLSLLGDFKDARKGGAVLSESQIDALRKLADSRLAPVRAPLVQAPERYFVQRRAWRGRIRVSSYRNPIRPIRRRMVRGWTAR
jgi:hypothetical protein